MSQTPVRSALALSAILVASSPAAFAPAAEPPAPYGPVPSARQLRWHELEFYGFLHFTVNTFTDKEWGYGDESPAVFNPTDFDADQIVGAAKAAGMKGLILTAKHHDGFCLWPSKLTEHSVKNSPWRDGKGDVVREIADACRRHGLTFGVYLSPWDRNHADYGRPDYLDYYRNQLRELMTGYGPLFEVWFDGANGGDGYYGGAREKRTIDRRTYYDWENTRQIVRDLQPDAVMFSDAGPDVRWVGNENGIAGDPCWATLNRDDFAPGEADEARLNPGDRPGTHWLPAECDVSIRPGWFYHASEDAKVKTPPTCSTSTTSRWAAARRSSSTSPRTAAAGSTRTTRRRCGASASSSTPRSPTTWRAARAPAPATCGAATPASPRRTCSTGRATPTGRPTTR